MGIAVSALDRMTQYHLAAAKLDRLDRYLMDNLADLPTEVSDRLLGARRRLLAELREPVGRLVGQPARREVETAIRLAGRWYPIPVPTLQEGSRQTPGDPDTEGAIEATYLGPGTVTFDGEPADWRAPSPGVTPADERWWVTNWFAVVRFPPAPESGYLSYRFEVENAIAVYPPLPYGMLRTAVMVGTAADVADRIHDWRTAGEPVHVLLPPPSDPSTGRVPPPFFGATVPVWGHIEVEPGHRPALGVLVEVIVALTSGSVRFGKVGECSFTIRLPEAGADSLIEYRFDPSWWTAAVKDRLDLDRTSLPRVEGDH